MVMTAHGARVDRRAFTELLINDLRELSMSLDQLTEKVTKAEIRDATRLSRLLLSDSAIHTRNTNSVYFYRANLE